VAGNSRSSHSDVYCVVRMAKSNMIKSAKHVACKEKMIRYEEVYKVQAEKF
jgi:hypothetical protein